MAGHGEISVEKIRDALWGDQGDAKRLHKMREYAERISVQLQEH